MISIFICLILACFVDLSQQKSQQLPTVLLPSIFRWDANNFIYVTQTHPTLSDESVDINLRVEGETIHGNKTQIFSETIRQKKGIQQQFKFNIPKLDSSKNLLKNFYVSINIDGHPHFSTVLAGAPDVNLINIQTDKAFYRPNERINIRALPLTSNGQIYKGPIQFQLLDPNGFRIFNKTNNGNLNDNDDSIELEEDDADISNNNEKKLKNAGFLREYFDLPKFLRYGNWRVLAFAGDYEQGSSSRFHTTIRVEEYEIPKFHVFMNLEEITDSPFSLNVDVFARFAHGLKVKGELTLRCLPLDRETSNENDEKEQSPSTKKLLSTQLMEGHWAGKVDLKVCGVTEQKHQKIKLIAEVVESGSFLSAKIIKEWDPFNSAFELIPLKPAFTHNTRYLQIYLRRRSLIEGNAELTTQCISEELSLNGLNHSLIARLGTIAEIKIDNKCLAYIIKARRKLIGGGFSSVETLVLPLLRGFDPFELSLIEINQNKVEYVEGEFIEAIIHNVNGRNFNYALICGNGRELASSGPINDGRIKIQTTESMGNGACVLYVYGSNGKNSETIVDMQLIFTKTGTCPKEQYGLTIPKANMTVGVPINITLRSHPNSLATLHIYDSRLDALIKRSVPSTSSNHLWTFSEFLSPEPGEHYYDNFIWFSNVVELHKLFLKRKEICQRAGKLAPQCPVEDNDKILNEHLQPFGKTKIPISASRFSTECLREIQEECERQKTIRQNANGFLTEKGQNNQQQNAWPLKTSGNGNQFMWMLNKKSYVQNVQETSKNGEMDDLKALRNGNQQTSNDNENVLLRHFFPEVWMFNDFYIGQKGELELNLNTPHTVTEWLFIPKFWTNGRRDVCKLVNKESLFVQKNVFMDVDVPSHIYVNETVTVKVTVTAENLNKNGESKRMAVCFKGLSPSVCGDVGRDGTAGEIDFTRIELTVEKPVQQKRFFVRFLRPGLHNLSFELRNEEVLKGHGWHCRDGNIHIFDRIVKQISVTNRVDIEEHFRQIVLYQRQSLPSRTVTLEQVLGEKQSKSESTTVGHSSQNYLTLRSSQDVISYSQQQPLKEEESEGEEEDDTTIIDTEQVKRQLITQIQINPGGLRVYSIGVEFSKFVASFPPALSTELIAASSPLSPQSDQYLQRLRNRSPVNLLSPSIAENLQTRRKRSKSKKRSKQKQIPIRKMPRMDLIKGIDLENGKENERPLQGYSLPNLLKELAQASYEFKSLRALLAGIESSTRIEREWLEQRERRLGNLLSELLTFSDCQGKKLCGFGEFGKPNKPEERSLVLTSLATSLLCEQRTPDEYICAPIQYLAQSVLKILNGEDEKDQIIAGLDAFAHFNDKKSKWLFLQALIVQVVLDCSAYACAASSLAKEAWMKLHSSFYRSVDLSEDYDVRVIAAFAYMSTPAIRSEMRAKLASRTVNDNHVPYWSVKEDSAKKSVKIQNLLEKSLQRSSIVLLNALALLAYTQNQSIYKFWRNEFNLEALSNWLIEQQDSNRQYENALDTFFATRALHQFAVVNAQRQMRQALTGTINANFTVYSPSSLPNNSRLFKDQDLPFGMFVEPTVRQMELRSRGDSQLLLGVKVQIEKRRRSRRDPNDVEPIVLSLEQKRIQHGFINQTVTIRCNSHLLNSIQIEHGIFTGFSSFAHFVHILKGSAKFQVEPRISATAVHFVLTNLIKEVDVVYTVALIEPNGGYLPENLAPISISAMHHHLPLAQLIVLPQDFDFLEDISNVELTSRGRRSVLTNSEKEVIPPAIFPVATSFLSPLETTKKEEGIDSLTSTTKSTHSHQFLNLITEKTDKPQSEIVETVCLQNGACTCAELSCTVKCSSCTRLTFSELCDNINSPEGRKFALFFRISPKNIVTVQIGDSSTEYTVLKNVRIMEWKSNEIEQPEHITIWIRSCNLNCLRMVNERREGELPRFLLIGDPRGLFDESDAVETRTNYANVERLEGVRSTKMLLQTHYLMRDDDRLLKSTDCYELFGKVEDESCI